jgi:hypothetical protein
MKGYYHLTIGRNRNQKTSHKYTLVCYKEVTDNLSPEDVEEQWKAYERTESTVIYYYGASDFLIKKFGMQSKTIFSIDANWPTCSRIWSNIEKFLPSGLTLSKWGYHFNDKPHEFITNSRTLLSDEEFLQILQNALNELPARTFSKKNRQKAIDSYMSHF